MEADVLRLEAATVKLMEHFDTVQIFATRHDHEGTTFTSIGQGNYFARIGHVRTWLIQEEHFAAHKTQHDA